MIDHHLRDSVKMHEGFRTRAYQDTEGVWTVGYGHNLEANGVDPFYAQFIVVDEEDGDKLLRKDLENAYAEASLITEFEYLNTRARRNVLIEMTFNLGRPRLLKFKKMLAALTIQDWERASMEMLDSRWALQVGRRAQTLSHIMELGTYDTD